VAKRIYGINFIYMTKQIIFLILLIITLTAFGYSMNKLVGYFRMTRPAFPIKNIAKRIRFTLTVAIGQWKIFRRPLPGMLHALVFWGFCIILFGSIEMILDGLSGNEKMFKSLGPVYDVLMASGDILALLAGVSVIFFLARRQFFHIKRFEGIEMNRWSHSDAGLSLSFIFLIVLSLLTMNMGYVGFTLRSGGEISGVYPAGKILSSMATGLAANTFLRIYEVSWWIHIFLIFIFANYLPYSKHFHVFLSVPNVFLSNLDPPGKLSNMESITSEVNYMMSPETAVVPAPSDSPPGRFGVKDVEDLTWKNYLDSLSCTQCGRCTAVCPANITGRKLSPRKVFMDIRARMMEKGPNMVKHGRDFSDNRSLIRDYLSEEEIWACTTCNACTTECPVNINQPNLIIDLRRYLVLEEASAPGELKTVFSNIENNGAPWQFPSEDRLLWTRDLEINII
jgi:heterodisulfide reductase subunit C